ncbi:MAG: EAL domain-containing protein [Aestuariibacter sp.]
MAWFEVAYYLSIGFAGFGAITFGAFSTFEQTRELKKQYQVFSCACFFISIYQYFVVYPLAINDLALHIQYLSWRTTTANITIFLVVIFFAIYTGQSNKKWILVPSFVLLSIFTVIELNNPGFIKFNTIHALEEVNTDMNFRFHRLTGEPSSISYIRHGFFLLLIGWVCFRAIKLWIEQRSITCIAILGYALLQFTTIFVEAYFVTQGQPIPIISGFGFCMMIAIFGFMMVISASKSQQLLDLSNSMLKTTLQEKSKVERREKLLTQIFDNSGIATLIIDDLGDIIERNSAFQSLFEDANPDAIENLAQLFQSVPMVYKELEGAIANNIPATVAPFEMNIGRADRSWLEATLSPVGQGGSAELYVLWFNDVSENVYVDNAIKLIARGLSKNTGQAFYEDALIHLQKLLKTDFVLLGESNCQETAETISTLAVCHKGQIIENFQYDLQNPPCSDVSSGITCCYPSDIQILYPKDALLKEMKIESYVGSALLNPAGQTIGILVALHTSRLERPEKSREIIEIFAAHISNEMARVNAENEIRQLAFNDQLTGLPNKASSHDYLKSFLRRLQKYGQSAWMALIDIDHLKRINDALGYVVGDEVIKNLSTRLVQQLASDFFIARISGDEFLLLSGAFSSEQTLEQHMRETLEKTVAHLNDSITVGDHVLDISVSAGAVRIPNGIHDHLDAIRAAEIAVYKAKEAGRNNFVEYATGLQKLAERKLAMEKEIRGAIAQEQFSLFYQPQFSIDEQMVGSEALIRWVHPDKGMIAPDDFIPIAEEAGLIHQIGRFVQTKACQFLANHQDLLSRQKQPQHLAINISAWEFSRAQFVNNLLDIVRHYGISPQQLTLELTESSLLSDINDARQKLERLRANGFSISLDDFGTGYSSLAYLRQLPVDSLKIDKAFVDKVELNQSNPLVESMIAIGRNMGINVVAEGVETQSQMKQLSLWGCECFQGYYFDKPLPEKDYLQRLKGDPSQNSSVNFTNQV